MEGRGGGGRGRGTLALQASKLPRMAHALCSLRAGACRVQAPADPMPMTLLASGCALASAGGVDNPVVGSPTAAALYNAHT